MSDLVRNPKKVFSRHGSYAKGYKMYMDDSSLSIVWLPEQQLVKINKRRFHRREVLD